jgi:hypothetical protein
LKKNKNQLDEEYKKKAKLEKEYDEKLTNLEKLQDEYLALRDNFKSNPIDISKPLPAETIKELEQFEQKVTQIKKESEYMYCTPFIKQHF